MAERDLREALREVDRALTDRGLPADVDRRLRARLDAHARPRRSTRGVTALAWGAAALAATSFVLWITRAQEAPKVDALALTARSADLATTVDGGVVAIVAGRGTFVDARRGVALTVTAGARFEPTTRGLRVERGRVELDVDAAMTRAEPYAVTLLGRTISTLGARFSVEGSEDDGRVEVASGRVHVVDEAGASRALGGGDVLTWRADAPETATSTAASASPATASPATASATAAHAIEPSAGPARRRDGPGAKAGRPSLGALVERLDGLRARGRWAEATTLLRAALDDGHPRATRERLSFELATIVSEHGDDRATACAEWTRHVAAFGREGRYTREVDGARARLGCSEP